MVHSHPKTLLLRTDGERGFVLWPSLVVKDKSIKDLISFQINLEAVEGIAALKGELNPEVIRVVFKDSGFKDDVVKTNAVQILRQVGIDDMKSL